MAARLDAVYKTEEMSKSEYDEGMKKYRDGTQEESVDYFFVGKDKYQRVSQQQDKLAEFIRWYAVEGGRGQLDTANTQCNIELEETAQNSSAISTLPRSQNPLPLPH